MAASDASSRSRRQEPPKAPAPSAWIRALVRLGITPNAVSYAGAACAVAAGACLAIGAGDVLPPERPGVPVPASWWPLAAGVLWGFSALLDLADGRLARGGDLQTAFGAVLDSTLDRFGDAAVFAGCAVYFAHHGNATYVLVSCLAATAAGQVSYVKARAENLVDGLGVGFWQRGERMVALLVGMLSGHVATALCVSAVFPLFTVLRRVRLARALLAAPEAPARSEADSMVALAPWRRRRSSRAYQLFCLSVAVAIVVAPWVAPTLYATTDPLGELLAATAAPAR